MDPAVRHGRGGAISSPAVLRVSRGYSGRNTSEGLRCVLEGGDAGGLGETRSRAKAESNRSHDVTRSLRGSNGSPSCSCTRDRGVPTRMLVTARPGYVVYEDTHQIAAVPFRDADARRIN